MALSGVEHDYIQMLVEKSTTEEREDLRTSAIESLLTANDLSYAKHMTVEERKAVEYAVEVLTRLECVGKGKGWWFRAKRRIQITQQYVGG